MPRMTSQHEPNFKRWVLYVAHDHVDPTMFCRGSRRAVRIAEPIKEDVLVQSVDVLIEKNVDIPSWLNGTPTLVDTDSKTAFTGSQALERLETAVHGDGAKAKTPQSLNDMEGVAASGARVSFAEDDAFAGAGDATVAEGLTDSKVTDEDVQRYMQMRNKSQPPPPPT